MASLVGLLAMIGSSRAKRPGWWCTKSTASKLKDAVRRAMEAVVGPVTGTVQGFEDEGNRRGVTVEIGRTLGYGVVAAYGERPEALIDAIRVALAPRLDATGSSRAKLAALWFVLAGGTVAILLVGTIFLSRPGLHAVRKLGG